MKIFAMIPARYAATRFPGKLMQPLGSKTVLRHTYDNTVATGLFDEVMVVTDSDIIYQEIARQDPHGDEHQRQDEQKRRQRIDQTHDKITQHRRPLPFLSPQCRRLRASAG